MGIAVDTTTIQVSKELARRWKVRAAMRALTYDALLQEMDFIYQTAIPFRCEEEFTDWLVQPQILASIGFMEVKERRRRRTPDLVLTDMEGQTRGVEVELIDRNFIHHNHAVEGVDLIIAAFGTEEEILGIPVIYFSKTLPMGRAREIVPVISGTLGTIKAYQTLSGYVYLHLSPTVCNIYQVTGGTLFSLVFSDGKLLMRQEAPCPSVGNSSSNNRTP